jgi:signal transduction histidine kinase
MAVLAVLAARATADRPGGGISDAVFDVAIGLGFIIAATIARGRLLSRALVASVGFAWLLGSVRSDAALLHMTVLAIALVTFPSGRPRSRVEWALVVLAVPVGLLLVVQPWISLLFVAVALVGLVAWRSGAVASPYSFGAGLGVAATLGTSWLFDRLDHAGFDPTLALRSYELVLLAVASCYPIAARAVERDRSLMTDRVLADTGSAGLEGLAAVLRAVLRDPDLILEENPQLGELAIKSRSPALDDPPIADAVTSAVRLTVRNVRLQDELASRLVELQAARMRLLDAVDDQRALTAARLRSDVLSPVARATTALALVDRSVPTGEGVEAARVAVEELATVSDEIVALVSGVAPAALGGGRLAGVIGSFAEHSPIPVVVTSTPAAAGSAEVESTLFYVAAEAVTNALKHAGANRILVAIDGDDHSVEISVSDDGCGGADLDGSGLQGVVDRLATRNGRLRVDSPPGTGTMLRATVSR